MSLDEGLKPLTDHLMVVDKKDAHCHVDNATNPETVYPSATWTSTFRCQR